MTQYVLVEVPPESNVGLEFYGGARQFWAYKGPEVILSGPYETGKTLGVLAKFHAVLCKYANSRALMTRSTYAHLVNSAIVTYEKKVLLRSPDHPDSPIKKYGGEKPEFYDYPNGSRIVVAGLDNPGKTLSSEYDFIYINQAEEIGLEPYEILTRAATGRAGNAPYTQIMMDCNPGPPTHWILHRAALKRFEQLHRHNPTLYDQRTGEITEQGKRTMAILNSLTGVRYKRGVLGLWAGAEGQVYDEFDQVIHVIEPFEIPSHWRRFRSIDFGFQNPFVCQWWAQDHDGRLYLYREIYMTKRTVKVHAEQIKRLSIGENIEYTVTDHDAEDRATLEENDISTIAAIKDITRGIQMVQEYIKVQGDGKPRFYVFKGALVEADRELYREYPGDLYPVCTEQEFTSYMWAKGVDGKPNKEIPVDLFNHGMDGIRYGIMSVNAPRLVFEQW